VNCITFSPRGDQIATSSDDSSVCVFEFPSGKLLHRFFGHQEGTIWHVAWSPSGDSLASVGNDGTIRVWDPQHGSSRPHLKLPESRSRASRGDWGFAQLEESGLWGFAFLEDGQHVSTVYHDGLNLLWDVTTGQSTSPAKVVDVAGAPTDVTAATAGSEDQHKNLVSPFPEAAHALLSQWDAEAYSIPTRFDLGSDGRVRRTECCARIVSNGSQIIEVGNGRLRRWTVHPFSFVGERRIDNLNAPGAPELVFDVSRDGRRVCGANDDGSVYVCDLNGGPTVHIGHFIRNARFSPNGDRILITHGDGVHEHDAYNGKHLRGFSNDLATAMSYSVDAQRIAVAYEPGYACMYDTLTGEETLRLELRASAILFASDGTSLVTDGAHDGGLYFWPGKK
jgi:WD40 repeat protein